MGRLISCFAFGAPIEKWRRCGYFVNMVFSQNLNHYDKIKVLATVDMYFTCSLKIFCFQTTNI